MSSWEERGGKEEVGGRWSGTDCRQAQPKGNSWDNGKVLKLNCGNGGTT